jgi:lipopolysaccharide/colanic/teichoic acid biosynthesis glycosyltransferase
MHVLSEDHRNGLTRSRVVPAHASAKWSGNDLFDRLAAGVGLVTLAPLLGAVAGAIAVDDGWPIFFRQTRVGRFGESFRLLKFRSMRAAAPGPHITAGADRRITRVGRSLRKYKLDEFPQLWNVVRGQMSLVGPRPEVPAYVNPDDPAWQAVLAVRPGITDLASLVYRNEAELLGEAEDPDSYYRERVLPEKLQLNVLYLKKRSFSLDLKLILLTVWFSFVPGRFDPDRIRRAFAATLDADENPVGPLTTSAKEVAT